MTSYDFYKTLLCVIHLIEEGESTQHIKSVLKNSSAKGLAPERFLEELKSGHGNSSDAQLSFADANMWPEYKSP